MIRLYIFVLIAITAFTGAATKEQNKTKGNGVDYDELHNELANSLVRKTMFKAVQQVSRAISRTNHRWRTECGPRASFSKKIVPRLIKGFRSLF